MSKYIILILCVLSVSIGQVLFKSCANTLKSLDSLWLLAYEPTFIIAMFCYGISTIGWIWCLQDIPLIRAYPFTSLGYVLVPLLAWIGFNEIPGPRYFISAGLILTGIYLAVIE